MASQDSAIHPISPEFHSYFGIRRATAFMFTLVLLVAIVPTSLSSSSETPRTATLSKRGPVAKSVVAEAYGKLPLSFEINQGQTDPRVKFLSRGSGYSLFLTNSEAVLRLRKGRPVSKAEAGLRMVSAKPQSRLAKTTPITDSVVRMRLIGANPNAKVSGLEELPGKSNYLIGKDPKNWRTNVPNYAKVKYANVYSGVDLVYYGNQRQLEYDFVLAPQANPRQIKLSFDGANRLGLDADGNLIVSIAGGKVIEHKPVMYQDIGGVRRQIVGGYELRNRHTVGFKLARYDDHRKLTIDPGLVYSTYLGGSNYDFGDAIALDSSGNAYVTGQTQSMDFPTTSGAFQTAWGGEQRSLVFVSKLNSDASALLYSTYLGGSGGDVGLGIALDSSGDAYVTGETSSSDFPTTAGAFQTTFGGGVDAFVSKLNSSGSALIYSTYLGGSFVDEGRAIALDSSGDAYVTGGTISNDFPTTPGAFQTGYRGVFVSKFNSNGSALIYSTYLGGKSNGEAIDEGYGIALDSSGDAYVTGQTQSSDFPTTAGAFQTTLKGIGNAFVSKFNSNGSALVYSTYLGGNFGDLGHSIAPDSSGDAYVTGGTISNDFPTTPGAFQTTFGGGADAFVTKLNSSGSALVYSTYLGGGDDTGFGIALDSSSNACVTGYTYSRDFPTTAGAFQTTYGGGDFGDAFVSKLNSTGSALLYSTYLGGNAGEAGYGIALDSSNNAYIVGWTASSNFPITAGAFQTTFGGGAQDAFVSKLALATFAGQPGKPNCHGQSVSALSNQYGSLGAAAAALGFPSVKALQNAIRAFCGG